MPGIMLSWVATALQIMGAAFLAFKITIPLVAYEIMSPGAMIWFVIAIIRRDKSLAALQAAFVIINTVGILRW